jgi:adenylosuccinate synthase
MSDATGALASETPQTQDLTERLDLSPGHCAVVGLQWGDEGKGKIVDILARRYDVVARYNGGANAGHTVVVGDQKFALHLVPSGILYPDKLNVLGNGVVVDPQQVIKELDHLASRDIKVADNFRISNRAHVVFPYHKLQDGLLEAALSKARGDGEKIGTTGRGIGPCYSDKAQRSTGVRMGELLNPDTFRIKLRHIVVIKNLMLAALAQNAEQDFEPIDADALCDQYLQYADRLRSHICDTTSLLHKAMNDGKQILFEGANATLLDIDHGTYPFVTSSNCSTLGVGTGTGVPGHLIKHIIGIVKAYQTRVGGGPMPTELEDETGELIRERGNEYGTTTGRPRRCGWLDLVALKYSVAVSGVTGISLMLLDVLAGFKELKICVGYEYQGEALEDFPADAAVLADITPVYETLKGFDSEITEALAWDQLPPEAQAYVQRIEEIIGVPIRTISVGPRRGQTLLR